MLKMFKNVWKLNMETESRLHYLRQKCFRLIVMKECEYVQKNIDDDVEFKYPIKIRDALYGGQTSCAVLYKDCLVKGKIFHIDFNSLYPDVQYKEYYPIGHPNILFNDEKIKEFIENEMKTNDRKTVFLKAKILPSQNLLFPILPLQVNNKLIFTLCNTCAIMKNHSQEQCNHSETDCCLRATWCLHEVYECLENGYKLLENKELLHYENKEKLFSNYIAKFSGIDTDNQTNSNIENLKKKNK